MHASIDVDALWQIAEKKLRWSLPPPADIHIEGLRCLASAMAAGSGDANALRLLRREVFAWIVAYLNFAKDQALYAEIPKVPVSRPLFIVGFGRTGSTLLHNLLALDENARAPSLWELWAPSPPPHPDTYATDDRIANAQHRLDSFVRAAPLLRQIHPMTPQRPDECNWMIRHNPLMVMLYRVTEYWRWLKHLSVPELHQLYVHYRLQVQHLQLFFPGSHWVSKASAHLHYLPVLFDVFPGANVVRLHRHPCRAIPSLCSLVAIYRSVFSSQVDHREIGKVILDMFTDGMTRSMSIEQFRFPQHFVDVHYDKLVANPIGTVRDIYEKLGYSYPRGLAHKMMRYLKTESRVPKQQHTYGLEQFGLTRSDVLDRSDEYLAWVTEHSGSLVEA